MFIRRFRYGWLGLLVLVAAFGSLVSNSTHAFPAKEKKEKPDKLDKDEKRRKKAAQLENESAYKHWISDEVPYIITEEEKRTFKGLNTDDEREQFIEAFWERRNPNPGTPENEFKEEYYRRIAYANEHYASGIPGWKADRGRIYIMYGPADEIDSHPSGGTYVRPSEEGGGETATYPFETWRYRYIDGIGTNIILEFVDPTMTGEYHLTMDPGEKDALLHVPGAGLTLMEQMGMAKKTDRFTRTDGMTTGTALGGQPESMNEFTRLDLYSKIWKPPAVKFKDMQAVVLAKLSSNLLPFDVRTDFIRVTDDMVLTPVTIQVAHHDLQFTNKNGIMHAVVDIYGQVNSPSGKFVTSFEDGVVLDVPEDQFQHYSETKSVYQKALPLRPGLYKVGIVVKDDTNGRIGTTDLGVRVPKYEDDKLMHSSLILADLIQPLPTNQVGTGPFVIGSTKVRPSVNRMFTRDQKMGIFIQVYNLAVDPQTHHTSMNVEYDITKDGKAILNQAEDAAKLANTGQQITLQKNLNLHPLQPGTYTVQIKVTDNVNKQTITPTETFEVR
jgi:GWxTD domain-containing protein